MDKFLAGLTGLALMAGHATATSAQGPGPIEGVWLTQSKTEMTITRCGTGYCGHISKIVVPEALQAQYGDALETLAVEDYVDANNSNPALRNRPIQGLRILTLTPTGNASIYEGEIYNPQDGNTYSGAIEVLGADRVRLKGCMFTVLCQEEDWTRLSGPLLISSD